MAVAVVSAFIIFLTSDTIAIPSFVADADPTTNSVSTSGIIVAIMGRIVAFVNIITIVAVGFETSCAVFERFD